MKEAWLNKYKESVEDLNFNSRVLVGFNANIDVTLNFEDLDINLDDVKKEKIDYIRSESDLKKVLRYCRDEETNLEFEVKDFEPKLDGEESIGGQAGIMSNFLSRMGHRSVMYTPFLSEEVVEKMDNDILYPVVDDGLVLKSVSDSVNSDRTKKNHIIEFKEESCRLILSDKLRGFGPYFRKGIEEKFSLIQEEVDKAIFSGFHDIDGNFDARLKKSEKQLRKLHIPKHLEFVSSTREKDKAIIEDILPQFTSVGMDESELKTISEIIGYKIDERPSLGEVYSISKKIIEEYSISRVHVHTRNFQTVVADKKYPVRDKNIRESLLFSGLAAVSQAERGKIPEIGEIEFNDEDMHLTRLDDLEHFQDFFELEDFVETGIARLEGCKVIAVPTIIHEEPERLVGMGDIISSGAFAAENHF